ncbi:MAG TPA: ZIP family metal transporter [Candidatus Woesebacteria bacterium]|nr:ZIP family metal transporter [Candidatus Woesebacteria bacterium]
MISPFWQLSALVIFGSILSLAGGVILLIVCSKRKFITQLAVPFAAGVLLSITFLGLLPEAVHQLNVQALKIVLLAFIGAYLFEAIFFDLHHHEHPDAINHAHTSSMGLIVLGDSIHNFIDGAAIAGAFMINTGLGVTMAISTFLHELPHEIGDFGLLLQHGFSKKNVLLINFGSSLSALVGAYLVYFWVANESVLSWLLAVTAGMFLYLSASDFLPQIKQQRQRQLALFAFIMGVLSIYFSLSLIPHRHH